MRKNSKNFAGEHSLGSFEVKSGELVVSDPCYDPGTWCAGRLKNVANGTWNATITISDEGSWGHRVSVLWVRLIGSRVDPTERTKFTVGVDSGQVCIVDADKFHGGEGEYGEKDTFYGEACELSMNQMGAGLFKGGIGVNSSSGYGDGSYGCYVGRGPNGQIEAVKVVFIAEENECETCGEWTEDEYLENGQCPSCRGEMRCLDCGNLFSKDEMNDAGELCLDCSLDEEDEEKDDAV